MANNPIDSNSFTFFLDFRSLGFTELYQISEVEGFDQSNFVMKQRDGSFGRDIYYSNEEIDLKFTSDTGFERGLKKQQIHPNGTVSEFLDFGFYWIMETKRIYGFEGDIYFVLKKDNVTFTVGRLDLAEPDTDGFSYIALKCIQNNEIAIYKRQLSSTIDVFSTKDIKGNPITPAPTTKFLLKSTPFFQNSAWGTSIPNLSWGALDSQGPTSGSPNARITNCASVIQNQGIDGTLTFPPVQFSSTFKRTDINGNDFYIPFNFSGSTAHYEYIKAEADLSEVEINITNIIGNYTVNMYFPATATVKVVGIVSEDIYNHSLPFTGYNLFGIDTGYPIQGVTENLPTNISYTIPNIPRDSKLYIYIECMITGGATGGDVNISASLTSWEIAINALSKSLDNVISGVFYIDMIKQCSKFIDELSIKADQFDSKGEHYKNICFNRAALSLQGGNSLSLTSSSSPEGSYLGQVCNNISQIYLPLGQYFWNGEEWILLDDSQINEVNLTDISTPSGTFSGQLAYNTNGSLSIPSGLCYWFVDPTDVNPSVWTTLEYVKPFVTTAEDCFGNSMTIESCSDYEITDQQIYFGKYDDFYTQTEIYQFLIDPSKDFKESWNPRFSINNLKFGYDTYEQNRLSPNTARDIHTEAEWSIPNLKVENKFERSIKYIRSAYSIQAMIDLEIKTPQTSDENDDKVFIQRIIEMPSTDCEFNITLTMSWIGNQLNISNKNTSSTDNLLNWNNRGFVVGQTIYISGLNNAGTYTIVNWSSTNLILNPSGSITEFNGDTSIKISYTYQDLYWMTETDENFSVIEGLYANHQYPNLYYSIRQNLVNWESYLNSACQFHQDKTLKNLYFKNNPQLKLQKIGGNLLIEKGDIVVSDLAQPLLTPKIYDLEVYASFTDILALLQGYKNNRGYVTCYDNGERIIKGYIHELDYTWKTGGLKLKLEEKFEPVLQDDTLIVTLVNGIITVNDPILQLNGTANYFNITGDYIEFFDEDDKPLNGIRKYDKVSLNGTIYTNIDDLFNALKP